MCIGMMDFEGKDELERRIAQNGTMYEQMQMMQRQMAQMAAIIDRTQGTNLMAAMAGQATTGQQGAGFAGGADAPNGIGGYAATPGDNSTAAQSRRRAAAEATPGEGES